MHQLNTIEFATDRRWPRPLGSWLQSPRRALTAVCLAATMAWAGIEPAHAGSKNYAIIVGNREPPADSSDTSLQTLRYADDDAIRYHALLSRMHGSARLLTVFDRETRQRYPTLSVDGVPTMSGLQKALAELGQLARQDRLAGDRVRFYFVFSGHGAIDRSGQAYLALLDRALTQQVLFDDIVAPFPADEVHIIIDACHAAGVVGVRGQSGFGKELEASGHTVSARETDQWLQERTLNRFPHVGVLVAATAGTQAHEWSEIEAGVFSHEVLSGLWGAADVNADLLIEYSELQAFIASANRRLADPRAIPRVVARAPAALPHTPLVDLTDLRETRWISGDARNLGRFSIELANGQRHLDAHLAVPSSHVGIPADTTAYLRTVDREATLGPSADRFAELTLAPRVATTRGSADQTYREGLFLEPFTIDYYRGYVDSAGAVPVHFSSAAKTNAQPDTATAPSIADQPSGPGAMTNAIPKPLIEPQWYPTDTSTSPGRQQLDRETAQRRGATAVAVIAGATGAAALVLGGVAGKAQTDFQQTDIERDAHSLQTRHRWSTAAAVTTGVVSAIGWIVAGTLFAKARRTHKARASRPGNLRSSSTAPAHR